MFLYYIFTQQLVSPSKQNHFESMKAALARKKKKVNTNLENFKSAQNDQIAPDGMKHLLLRKMEW